MEAQPETIQLKSREGEFKRRTSLLSRKEQIRRQLLPIFARAEDHSHLEAQLRQAGFTLYQRGQQEGVIDQSSGKRYRLRTLGLEFARFVIAEREQGARSQEKREPERNRTANRART